MVVLWPLVSYMDHVNVIIFTFIGFTADLLVGLKKNKDIMYSEFAVVTGKPPRHFGDHVWLIGNILAKTIRMAAVWAGATCIHVFSPLYHVQIQTRMFGFYSSVAVYILCTAMYRKIYKRWAIAYTVVSTNDTEASFTR